MYAWVLNAVNWTGIAEVYEKSYDEVLSALKHQDDKLNRTLTAIAFLTAAGVALFANSVNVNPPVHFEESSWNVTSFFFLIFLGAVVFALLFALTAIGPNRVLPRLWGQSERKPEVWPSLLFYQRIIKDPEWDERIETKDVEWLQQCLARSFHGEAKTIGRRVEYKVAGSRQSGACVQIALLALSLLGIFSIVQISLERRWWIAAALLTLVLLMPLLDAAHMWKFEFSEASELGKRKWSYALVSITAAAGTFLLFTAPASNRHWWAIFYCLGAVLAIRLAFVHEWFARVGLWGAAMGGVILVLLACLL
jgi:hypothetical protein